uniref:Uncharacterized protein n=1 Tax=Alexandrium monilatum TaxID=311494 RepID=A0A7S4W1X3_9DINO
MHCSSRGEGEVVLWAAEEIHTGRELSVDFTAPPMALEQALKQRPTWQAPVVRGMRQLPCRSTSARDAAGDAGNDEPGRGHMPPQLPSARKADAAAEAAEAANPSPERGAEDSKRFLARVFEGFSGRSFANAGSFKAFLRDGPSQPPEAQSGLSCTAGSCPGSSSRGAEIQRGPDETSANTGTKCPSQGAGAVKDEAAQRAPPGVLWRAEWEQAAGMAAGSARQDADAAEGAVPPGVLWQEECERVSAVAATGGANGGQTVEDNLQGAAAAATAGMEDSHGPTTYQTSLCHPDCLQGVAAIAIAGTASSQGHTEPEAAPLRLVSLQGTVFAAAVGSFSASAQGNRATVKSQAGVCAVGAEAHQRPAAPWCRKAPLGHTEAGLGTPGAMESQGPGDVQAAQQQQTAPQAATGAVGSPCGAGARGGQAPWRRDLPRAPATAAAAVGHSAAGAEGRQGFEPQPAHGQQAAAAAAVDLGFAARQLDAWRAEAASLVASWRSAGSEGSEATTAAAAGLQDAGTPSGRGPAKPPASAVAADLWGAGAGGIPPPALSPVVAAAADLQGGDADSAPPSPTAGPPAVALAASLWQAGVAIFPALSKSPAAAAAAGPWGVGANGGLSPAAATTADLCGLGAVGTALPPESVAVAALGKPAAAAAPMAAAVADQWGVGAHGGQAAPAKSPVAAAASDGSMAASPGPPAVGAAADLWGAGPDGLRDPRAAIADTAGSWGASLRQEAPKAVVAAAATAASAGVESGSQTANESRRRPKGPRSPCRQGATLLPAAATTADLWGVGVEGSAVPGIREGAPRQEDVPRAAEAAAPDVGSARTRCNQASDGFQGAPWRRSSGRVARQARRLADVGAADSWTPSSMVQAGKEPDRSPGASRQQGSSRGADADTADAWRAAGSAQGSRAPHEIAGGKKPQTLSDALWQKELGSDAEAVTSWRSRSEAELRSQPAEDVAEPEPEEPPWQATAEQAASSSTFRSSGAVAAVARESTPVVGSVKEKLREFFTAYCGRPLGPDGLSYLAVRHKGRFQATLKLHCVEGRECDEFVGDLCDSPEEAQISVAQYALQAYAVESIPAAPLPAPVHAADVQTGAAGGKRPAPSGPTYMPSSKRSQSARMANRTLQPEGPGLLAEHLGVVVTVGRRWPWK